MTGSADPVPTIALLTFGVLPDRRPTLPDRPEVSRCAATGSQSKAARPQGNTIMDALSQTLRVVRLVGAIFINARFTAPVSYTHLTLPTSDLV